MTRRFTFLAKDFLKTPDSKALRKARSACAPEEDSKAAATASGVDFLEEAMREALESVVSLLVER